MESPWLDARGFYVLLAALYDGFGHRCAGQLADHTASVGLEARQLVVAIGVVERIDRPAEVKFHTSVAQVGAAIEWSPFRHTHVPEGDDERRSIHRSNKDAAPETMQQAVGVALAFAPGHCVVAALEFCSDLVDHLACARRDEPRRSEGLLDANGSEYLAGNDSCYRTTDCTEGQQRVAIRSMRPADIDARPALVDVPAAINGDTDHTSLYERMHQLAASDAADCRSQRLAAKVVESIASHDVFPSPETSIIIPHL